MTLRWSQSHFNWMYNQVDKYSDFHPFIIHPLFLTASHNMWINLKDTEHCDSPLDMFALLLVSPLSPFHFVFVVFFNPHEIWEQKCPPLHRTPLGHNYWGVSSSFSNTVVYSIGVVMGMKGCTIHPLWWSLETSCILRLGDGDGVCDGCCWSHQCGWCSHAWAGW